MNRTPYRISGAARAASLMVFIACLRAGGQTPRDFAVDLSASVATSAPCITLNWSLCRPGNITAQAVHRRLKGEAAWAKLSDLATNATAYADGTALAGVEYEYWMERTYTGIYPSTAMGYLSAGVNVPMTESRGKLLLVVDDTMAAPLAPEISQLQEDLVGDGWSVLTITALRTNAPSAVKSQILAAYGSDPANVKMVYLLGHVPVPYSGDMAPDLHVPDHLGAWPADGYYGEMTGSWTDSTVNDTAASRSQNDNVPGDGKFDQSYFPSYVELIVGRVDMCGMTRAPCASVTEATLLRRYLRKAHDFRYRQGAYATVPRQSLIRDGFGHISGESFAMAGWAWAFTGAGASVDEAPAGQWFSGSYAGGKTYLIAYGNGGGTYESASALGDSSEFGLKASRALFTSLFGSYFGDWDAENSLLRAPLAGNATDDSLGLTCLWGGRPNRFLHHLGMGETVGYGLWTSQNGSLSGGGGYMPNNDARTHSALMGDPALRLYAVEPPRNLAAASSNSLVSLTWAASTEANLLGYHVYRAASVTGAFARLTPAPLAAPAYTDSPVTPGQAYTYLVRTLKRELVPGGSFYNLSAGSFVSLTASGVAAAAPRNPGGPTVALTCSTNALLAWADTSANESGFRIERKLGPSGGYLTVGAVSANVTNYIDRGVFTNGNCYYYRVVSTNSAGASAASPAASAYAVAGFFDMPVTRLKADKSAGSASLTVRRIGGAVGGVSVAYATSNTSALAGTHYLSTTGTLVWADGDAADKTITVPLVATPWPQAPREFIVRLSQPAGGADLTVNAAAAVLIEDATAALDAPWSQALVGGLDDSSAAVSVSNAVCSTTLGGGGLSALATCESGQFVYQNRAGDGTLTAFFPSGLPDDPDARYAVMVRASLASNAAMAAAASGSGAAFGAKLLFRGATGEGTTALPSAPNALNVPRWLRITRIGSLFSAETSATGASWDALGSALLPGMPSTAAWGVFHASKPWSNTALGDFHLAAAQSVSLADMPAPSAPTGLSATAVSPTRVVLSWRAVANAAGYRIERASELGSFTQIVDVAAAASTTQTWSDASAAADSGYRYRMTAYNATGVSAFSDVACATTPAQESVVLLSCAGPSGGDAAVRYDLPATPFGADTNLTVAGYDPDTWDLLTNAAKVYLRFDLAGQSFERARLRLSFAGSERFDEAGFINCYAFALSEASDVWSEGSITWNSAPQNDLTGAGFTGSPLYLGYTNLYAAPAVGEGVAFELPATALSAARGANGLLTLGLAQLTAGAISHWASREHPSFAGPALELISPSPVPPRPTFLTAAVESGWSVTLRWADGASNESGYLLQRRLTNGVFATVATLPSNSVSHVDGTTSPASAYDYRLCAFNASGTSSWATVSAITTPDAFHAVGTLWDAGGTDTLLTTASNWDSDLTPVFDGQAYFNFGAGGSAATVNTNAAVLGLSIHRDADFELVDGGGTLSIGSGGLRAACPSATPRAYAVSARVSLAADQRWGVTNNGAGATTLLVSGPISDGEASFGLAKSGAGLLILAGSNAYDGATSVATGGALRVTHSWALGGTNGATTVSLGAWLEVGGTIAAPEPLTLAGDADGQGNLRSTDGTNVWSGRITQAAVTRVRALADSKLTLSGGVSGAYDFYASPDADGEVVIAGGLASGSAKKLVAGGAGITGLSGSGSSFGTLEIAGGTVRMDGTNALAASAIVSIGTAATPGGTLDLNGNSQTISQLKRGLTTPAVRVVTSAAPATLTVSGTTSTTYDGQFAGALSLFKTNTSTLTISGTNNCQAGATTVSGGTLDILAAASLGSSAVVRVTGGTLRLRNATAIADTSALSISAPGKVRLDALFETVGALYLGGTRRQQGTYGSTASVATFKDNTYFDVNGTGVVSTGYAPPGTVWDGGGADLKIDNPNNWDTDISPLFNGAESLTFGAGGAAATVNTNVSLYAALLRCESDFSLAGGATLTLGAGGLSASAPSAAPRAYALSAAVALASNQVWSVTNSGADATLVVTGSVRDDAYSYGISKSGDGLLVLAGSNSYDGATSVGAVALRVTHPCGLGSTNGNTAVSLGARVELGGGASVPEPLLLSGDASAAALASTDGTNAWTGRITLAAASRVAAQAESRLALSGGVSGSFDLSLDAEPGAEIAAEGGFALGSARKLSALGGGRVTIGGAGHTFGTLEIGGSTVVATAPNALPSALALTVGSSLSPSGCFDLNGCSQVVGQLRRGSIFAGARVVTTSQPATLTVSGTTSTVYDGALTGPLSLVKSGSSILSLTGPGSTLSGSVTLAGGTLDIGTSSSLGCSSNVTVSAGLLRLQGTNGIPAFAALSVANGAVLRLDEGTNTVRTLVLGGKLARKGTWGAAGSGAQYIDSAHFSTSGAGVLNVLRGVDSVLMLR
jgi:autotransporter-associated beta strand protein